MIAGFGERLKYLRNRRGLTLQQLANAVGSKKAYMWQLENKQSADPSLSLSIKLATALHVEVRELMPPPKPL